MSRSVVHEGARAASSDWRVDTGQRAGKASLLVLRCDMPPSQRVKRYEVAVGSMPPPPAREPLRILLTYKGNNLGGAMSASTYLLLLSAAMTTMSWRNAIAEVG